MDARTRGARLRTRRTIVLALTVAGAALLAGCTDARLVDVWKDPAYSGRPIESVLVVSQEKNGVQRRLWEDELRSELLSRRVNAVASYTLFPDGAPGQSMLTQAIRDHDLGGAIVVHRLAPTSQTRWVPGWSSVEPRDYYNPWTRRDVIVYRSRWHRGYRVTDRIARVQFSVWTADDGGRMVWAGTAEVPNPSSPDDLRHELSGGLIPGMKKVGLLAT